MHNGALVYFDHHPLSGVFPAGFGIGVYTLPILTAAPSVEEVVLVQAASEAEYQAEFRRGLRGNDFVHWGKGW